MKELFVQYKKNCLYPSSEEDLEVLRHYKPNQILRCRIQGAKKPRSIRELNLYWAACNLVSENTDNKLWNTKEKVDFQCRVKLHFVDPDVVVVQPDGTVIFNYRSIAFANLAQIEAHKYFDRAFTVMSGFLNVTVEDLVEMTKDRCGANIDFQ
jgi:hypothetical protein